MMYWNKAVYVYHTKGELGTGLEIPGIKTGPRGAIAQHLLTVGFLLWLISCVGVWQKRKPKYEMGVGSFKRWRAVISDELLTGRVQCTTIAAFLNIVNWVCDRIERGQLVQMRQNRVQIKETFRQLWHNCHCQVVITLDKFGKSLQQSDASTCHILLLKRIATPLHVPPVLKWCYMKCYMSCISSQNLHSYRHCNLHRFEVPSGHNKKCSVFCVYNSHLPIKAWT
jgi:hypothetical protein